MGTLFSIKKNKVIMVKIFVSGGTFDKGYNELNEELLFNSFYKYYRSSPLYTKGMSNI